MSAASRIAAIVPAYLSDRTVAACVASLAAQELPPAEIVVVDSSPDPYPTRAALAGFPAVRLHHHPGRLFPHAARNLGVDASAGELLFFTDPDMVLAPDCLTRLTTAHRRHGGLVVAGLACHGARWLDRGVHLVKFSKWLPGGEPHPVDVAPTAALLCSRADFERLGRFRGELLLADALFSWHAGAQGVSVWLESGAVACHHHSHSLASFLAERAQRGPQLAQLRAHSFGFSRSRAAAYGTLSLLPVRLPRAMWLTFRHASASGRSRDLAATWPLVVAGHLASCLGEGLGYLRWATSGRARA